MWRKSFHTFCKLLPATSKFICLYKFVHFQQTHFTHVSTITLNHTQPLALQTTNRSYHHIRPSNRRPLYSTYRCISHKELSRVTNDSSPTPYNDTKQIPPELQFILKLTGPELCAFAEQQPLLSQPTAYNHAAPEWTQRAISMTTAAISTDLNSTTANALPSPPTAFDKSLPCWSLIASRALDIAPQMHALDALRLLQAFAKHSIVDGVLYSHFTQTFLRSIYQFSIPQLCQLLSLYAVSSIEPRILFGQIFNLIIKRSNQLYASEFVMLFETFAKCNIANESLLGVLISATVKQLANFRCSNLITLKAALHAIPIEANNSVYALLDTRFRLELQLVTPQELFDALIESQNKEFGWKDYELQLKNEFLKRLEAFRDATDVDQLADPFACLDFLKLKNIIVSEYLLALSHWCKEAVKRPATRSYKRPLVHQLVQLYDIMRERDLENDPNLVDAIAYFIASKGGKDRSFGKQIKPLSYQSGRRYVYMKDAMRKQTAGSPSKNRSQLEERPNLPLHSHPFGNTSRHTRRKISIPSPLATPRLKKSKPKYPK